MKAEQISIFNYTCNTSNDIDKIDVFNIMHKIEIQEPSDIYFYKGDLIKENYKNDIQNDKTL